MRRRGPGRPSKSEWLPGIQRHGAGQGSTLAARCGVGLLTVCLCGEEGPLEAPGGPIRGFRTQHASQAQGSDPCTPDTIGLVHGTPMILSSSTAPKVQATYFLRQDPPSQPPRPEHCSAAGSAPQSQIFFVLTKALPANTHKHQEPMLCLRNAPAQPVVLTPRFTENMVRCPFALLMVDVSQRRPASTEAGPELCSPDGLLWNGASVCPLGAGEYDSHLFRVWLEYPMMRPLC